MSVFQQIQDRFRPNPESLPTVLEIDLARGVITHVPTSPIEAIRQRTAVTIGALRRALEKGRRDDSVVALLVHVGTCPLLPGDVDEVAELIAGFDKPSVAWTETFGELVGATDAYKVACAADEIWLQPTGTVGLTGYRTDITLFRGVLEKVGITPAFEQRKEYKSAAETFAGHEVSDANREMVQRFMESMLTTAIDTVARSRGLTVDAVRELTARGPVSADEARSAGLVDHVGYRDEVLAAVRERFGRPSRRRDDASDVHLHYAHRYAHASALTRLTDQGRPGVGVVQAIGDIMLGPSRPGPGGSTCGCDTLAAHLRAAARDDSIRAVVLRVDSGGGSAVGSDQVRREVQQLRAAGKPVIASMGNVAASGGYFIAMAADQIVANPTTLTGSIGVLGGKFVLDELDQRIGLIRESVAAGAHADMWSTHAFTDEDLAILDQWLDRVYADFTAKAAEDRGMSLDDLEAVARGRVWTGADALDKGLVDRLGGISSAIRIAADAADLDRSDLTVRPVGTMPWLDQIRPPESSEANTTAGAFDLGPAGLFRAAAVELGLTSAGVLSMPGAWRVRSR